MSADKSFYSWVKVFIADDADDADDAEVQETDHHANVAPEAPMVADATDELPFEDVDDPSASSERVDIDGALFRIRPPRGRRFAISAMGAESTEGAGTDGLDLKRIRPPRGLSLPPRMSQLLRTQIVDRQPYRLGGYAMAGWWNLPVVYGGKLGDGFLDVAFHPVLGTVNDAAEWIRSDSGKAWRKDAHSWFLVEFRAESGD